MDIIPKKSKVTIKIKPHTIQVGAKKPENGGKAIETPINPVNLRKPFWKRCVEVVKEDLHLRKIENEAIMKDEPTWEEYLRFKELARGKR